MVQCNNARIHQWVWWDLRRIKLLRRYFQALYAMQCDVRRWYKVMQYNEIMQYDMLWCIVLCCHVMWCAVTSCDVVSCDVVMWCAIMCCVWCGVLWYRNNNNTKTLEELSFSTCSGRGELIGHDPIPRSQSSGREGEEGGGGGVGHRTRRPVASSASIDLHVPQPSSHTCSHAQPLCRSWTLNYMAWREMWLPCWDVIIKIRSDSAVHQ